MEHVDIPVGEIHIPHNWSFADAAARGAATIVDTTLIDRIALQVDEGSYWRLTAVSPATWVAVKADPRTHVHEIEDITNLQTTLDGKAASSHGHVIADVTGLQTALDDKANLAGAAFTGEVSITGGKLKPDATEIKVSALGSVSGTVTLDLLTAGEFTATLTGNTTFAFDNAPGANQAQIATLRLTDAGAHVITWPASTKFAGGALGTLTTAGVDVLGAKYDATTSTYMVFVIGKDVK